MLSVVSFGYGLNIIYPPYGIILVGEEITVVKFI